jgi:hypothetical protein
VRRRLLGALSPLALALASLGAGPDAAEATPALSQRIEYVGLAPGNAFWHATNQFPLVWAIVGNGGAEAPTGFGYRIDDAAGHPLGPASRLGLGERLVFAAIPRLPGQERVPPGTYQFELWLESDAGDGPHLTAPLLFDDTRPDAVRPIVSSDWIRAGAEADVRIEHPTAPQPPSGILGYAVELDHGSGSGPCGGRGSCEPSEVDLDGGENDDLARVGPLTAGLNIVRVVAVSKAGVSSEPSAGAALRVDGTPPGISLAGVPAGWSGGPVEVTANAADAESGMSPNGAGSAITAIAVDGGAATVTAGGVTSAVVHGEGTHVVGAFARDSVGNLSPGGGGSTPPPLARVRIDETVPSVAFAIAEDPAEPERIVAFVADALAGPSPDRGSITVRALGSAGPFSPIPTTVTAGKLTALWDSDSYPLGGYEFRAFGYDLAGNRSSTGAHSDGRPMILENPVKTPTALSFGFGGRRLVWHRCTRADGQLRCQRQLIGPFELRPATRTVAYGRGVPIGGRLTTTAGPLSANQPVAVTEVFAAGSELRERRTTVLTGAGGIFLAHLAPGPSRRVEVSFGGSPTLTRSVGRELRVRSRAALRLRSSVATAAIGGAPVVFTGSVAHDGASVPATGLPVELQFRLPGMAWSEFRTVQTGPDGRFRYPYSFSDDDSRGVRFQFRAHLAAQSGWPFEPGTSRPIAITGR